MSERRKFKHETFSLTMNYKNTHTQITLNHIIIHIFNCFHFIFSLQSKQILCPKYHAYPFLPQISHLCSLGYFFLLSLYFDINHLAKRYRFSINPAIFWIHSCTWLRTGFQSSSGWFLATDNAHWFHASITFISFSCLFLCQRIAQRLLQNVFPQRQVRLICNKISVPQLSHFRFIFSVPSIA